MKFHELHRRALEAARKFFQAEAELLDLIQKIDGCKGFRDLGHTSLFSYAVGELKLSESVALNLINVARKAIQIPALKTEIQSGNLSVCKARKIVSVLNVQNQVEWIEKAKALPTRKLEKEIAKTAPGEAFPERVRYVTETRVNLSFSLDEKTLETIKRVQDLESQRKGRAVTLEETLAAMAAFYVEKNDPVEKAKRVFAKISTSRKTNLIVESSERALENALHDHSDVTVTCGHAGRAPKARTLKQHGLEQMGRSLHFRQPIPAATEHALALRDGGQCTAKNNQGVRCEERRWLHVHHIKHVSKGGSDAIENLTTLCSAHHKMRHDRPA
ncbi:MAG: HNH endonuclease [Deltaproteobacteria bacterium]|nr:HNH endonuclease [Deltaproteobacteria bacterium]